MPVKLLLLLLLLPRLAAATEGMWLPQLLARLNEREMKGMGMKISAADIYSVNKGSLKDAIVSFGGFCTASVISSKGLLLTNHHCGYSAVQQHSNLQHNYLQQGFWAAGMQEELPNPGLTATFIVRVEDVTREALREVTPGMDERQRQAAIDRQLPAIRRQARKEAWQEAMVKPFFEGNQYYLFITETYRDVRLVGAPPSAIGKFGSDTDNWVWPRHTGDFSLFRIYADRHNRPASYSKDNVPLQPRRFLPVSLKGMQENDFTLVFGFPGRTNEYLPAVAVKQQVELLDAARVAMRGASLHIIDSFMRADEQTRIQYAAKYATIANYWKKWQGEMQGVARTGALAKKQAYEAQFRRRVNSHPAWKNAYGALLDSLNSLYELSGPYAQARDYFSELARNIELFAVTDSLIRFLNEVNDKGPEQYEPLRQQFLAGMAAFYRNYRPEVDREVAAALLDIYFRGVPSRYIGGEAYQIWMETNKNGRMTADRMYSRSGLVSLEKLQFFLARPYKEVLARMWADPATRFVMALQQGFHEFVMKPLNAQQPHINRLQRRYMQAQMEVMGDSRRFYPDANSTLRVTYGKVNGYTPRDAVHYEHYTWLDGIMEKYKPGDYEFDVPEKLISLYREKDYGVYGVNGRMPVCFIGTNHTTGGNSGSPVLNAYGQLAGLNFDRTWEGTMSDFYYDGSICRNIMVDIRYILFIVDKFAGASHLVKEMTLVR